MRYRLLHFAQMRELCGCVEEIIDSESQISMATLWEILCSRHEALAAATIQPLPVLDRRYVTWDALVPDGGEVSFFPPLGGG
jgi:molybdopterin converting factor small subunit